MEYSAQQLKFFKENYPYTDNGFFNLKGYINECVGPDWPNKSFSMIIQAERNMGKSYGTWDFIEKEIWIKSNFTERIAYLRTNLTKLKPVKSFFNSKYAGKYLMTDTHIWKIELDENGKEIRENRIELGVVIGVMNEENWRSGEFANYRMIFWDEYNETTTYRDIFIHWVNLFKTIERMTPNLIAVLVGNKIRQSNDILVNLEIELPNHLEQTEDYLITRTDSEGNERIFFVDIAPTTFAHLSQKDKLANVWATFNEETNIFLNEGGYLEQTEDNVLIYRTRILPTRKIKWYVSYGDFIYEYGSFERGVYFHKVNKKEAGYNTISLNVLGHFRDTDSKALFGKEDYVELAQLLVNKSKHKQLFFSSYETRDEIEFFITHFAILE